MKIQKCRLRLTFDCIYLTKDTDKEEFLREVSPWILKTNYLIKENGPTFIVYCPDSKATEIYPYDSWYVKDEEMYYRNYECEYFDEEFEVVTDE